MPAKLQAYAPFSRTDQVEPEEDVDVENHKGFLPGGQEENRPSGAGEMGGDTSRTSSPNASPAPSPRRSDVEEPGPLLRPSIGPRPSQSNDQRGSQSRSSSMSRNSISSDTGRSEWRPGGRLQTDGRVILQLMRRVEWLSVMKETTDRVSYVHQPCKGGPTTTVDERPR